PPDGPRSTNRPATRSAAPAPNHPAGPMAPRRCRLSRLPPVRRGPSPPPPSPPRRVPWAPTPLRSPPSLHRPHTTRRDLLLPSRSQSRPAAHAGSLVDTAALNVYNELVVQCSCCACRPEGEDRDQGLDRHRAASAGRRIRRAHRRAGGGAVAHVAAHMTMPFRYSAPRFVLEMVWARGSFHRLNDRIAARDHTVPQA